MKSARPVKEILDRLQKLVTDEGFFIVGRVPHSDAAKGAGLTLRPTELMIFGKPQSDTPVMVCGDALTAQAAIPLAVELPPYRDRAVCERRT